MNVFLEKHADKIVTLSDCGCMIWTAAATPKGYGTTWSGRRSAAGHKIPIGAHRMSFAAQHGPIPTGMSVLHRCDVPSCVNPDHLFLGTTADNIADMVSKGRSCLGERHGRATMTADVVRKLRAEYRFRSVTSEQLAEKYGLTRSAVAAVIRRQTWKHI